ncbi:MAG: Ig-like domain-containing protein [Pirellulales bacterium]
MGQHRSVAWGKNGTSGKASRRTARAFQARRIRLELLEPRHLLSCLSPLELDGVGFSADAGILTASPAIPDLLDVSDSGVSSTDNLTNLDNSQPGKSLRFAVGNTIAGAKVTLYADGLAIGNAVAAGATTTVTTNGSLDLPDGKYGITVRQVIPGSPESADSAVLAVTIDTVAPVDLNPTQLGSLDTAGVAYDVAIVGTLAYVADGNAGLQILDIANPAAPIRLGGYDTAGSAFDVVVSGTRAYVTDQSAGLVILDVSNPAAPAPLGGYDTLGSARGVAVAGTLAYVADHTGGLVIIDVSDPAAPVERGVLATGSFAQGVTVSGTLVYVAYGNGGLGIVDASNPAAPVALGTFDTTGYASGVDLAGTLAYVADGSAGLVIIDVANPSAPVRLGGLDTSGGAHSAAVRGTLAYVADDAAGLVIIDARDPAAPLRLGGLDTSGHAYGVAMSGTLAYVADGADGLAIIDAGVPVLPATPDLQSASDTGVNSGDNITGDNTPAFDVSVRTGSYFRVERDGVQISGDYESGTSFTAAVQPDGTYGYAVRAVDAAGNASVASPELAVTVDALIPAAPELLAASDSGRSQSDRITNFDNSQPDRALAFTVGNTLAGAMVTIYADGVAIGSAVAEGATTTVTTNGSLELADGTHAFTARQTIPGRQTTDSEATLVTIDTVVLSFLNPVSLSTLATGGTANSVVVVGTLAYATLGTAGLQILDVSNPAAPVRLGEYHTGGHASAVAVSGTRAYVTDHLSGLTILDMTDPAKPERLGAFPTRGYASGVALAGTVAYVADDYAGLVILDVSDAAKPIKLGECDAVPYADAVTVSGTLAYVAGSGGLAIIDVSNPAVPVQLGTFSAGGWANGMVVSGAVAYMAASGAGLVMVDVSDPAAPVELGTYDTSGSAEDVTVVGTLAYVLDRDAGLLVLDVSDPAAPVLLGMLDTSGRASGLALSEGVAYVADGSAGLAILNVGASDWPSSLDLRTASDLGISATDNITADNTPSFNLSVPTGSYFRVYRDGVKISGDIESRATYGPPTVQADGTYAYTLAVLDVAGNISPESLPLAVTIETQAPAVANLVVSGTSWTGDYVGGYSIPVGSGSQLNPLLWANINQIKVVFTEDMGVDKADLTLVGFATAAYDLGGAAFSYDPVTLTATWTLATALAADRLELRLNADGASPVQDVPGNRLDGEWTNPLTPADTGTDTYPSGNGTAGGDFVFRFIVMPCDTNRDGAVDIFDVAKLQVNYGTDHGMTPEQGDFNGDGRVDIFDVALLQVDFGRTLVPPPAPAPSAMPGAADDLAQAIAMRRGAGRPAAVPEKGTIHFSGMAPHSSRIATSRKSRMSPIPKPAQPLAVRHAVENACWESAVDQVLESAGNPRG